jgi:hypothetical protein
MVPTKRADGAQTDPIIISHHQLDLLMEIVDEATRDAYRERHDGIGAAHRSGLMDALQQHVSRAYDDAHEPGYNGTLTLVRTRTITLRSKKG